MRVRVRDSKYGHYAHKGEGRKGTYGKGYSANAKNAYTNPYSHTNANSCSYTDAKPNAESDTKPYSSITNASAYPDAANTGATSITLILLVINDPI